MPMSRRVRVLLPLAFLIMVAVLGLIVILVLTSLRLPTTTQISATAVSTSRTPIVAWPRSGQAAYSLTGDGPVVASGRQRPVPIASVTKIMTALVVLEQAPLEGRADDGFRLTVTAADVADTERRRARSESVIMISIGDTLTQRQALLGLLLPSANNMAHLLAVATAGSEAAFVDLMNQRARQLKLRDTTYADVSGFDPGSRSTARDQTVLARTAMADPIFAWLVSQPRASLPTAGPVTSTNQLLGDQGFVGVKTGSTTPAGGCFVFAARRLVDGRPRLVVGAVLGQRDGDLLDAAFDATERLVSSVSDPPGRR